MRYSFSFPVRNSLRALVRNFLSRRHVPVFLSLDVTRKCNARCPFCGFWKSEPSGEMTLEEIRKILEDAYGLGCIVATITGGEPFLRRDLPTILEYAKNAGLTTFLLTNGSLLESRIKEVYRNLDVVSVSIDFPDSRHDETRGIKDLFQKAMRGINLAQSLGVTANINSIITSAHTLKDVEDLLALAERLNCGITFAPMFELTELHEHTAYIGRLSEKSESMKISNWENIRTIADRLLYHKNHQYRKTIQNTGAYLKLIRDRGSFTCYPLSLQIGISTNGDVSSVCPIGIGGGHYVGNALKQDLKEIWYSERAERLREKFKNCKMAQQVGCYLLCVAEFSLLYDKPSTMLDYLRRLF
ncbi:MAG: radical SAM protein [Candidatus Bathyarchaeia archaeon]